MSKIVPSPEPGEPEPKRVFLGWDAPLPQLAARWMVHELGDCDGGLVDLEGVVVVVPGRRAARRLLLALVAEAEALASTLAPPAILTPGALPERFATLELPAASPLAERLARVAALRAAPEETLEPLLPGGLPAREDAAVRGGSVAPWLDLAADLERVDDVLAAEGLELEGALTALRRVEERTALEGIGLARWEALVRVAEDVDRRLAAAGSQRRACARLAAAGLGGIRATSARVDWHCEGADHVVVVGVADLASLFRRLLQHLGIPLSTLVHAPVEEAQGFDAWGCPRSDVADRWRERPLAFDRARLELVPGSLDQCAFAALAARELRRSLGAADGAEVAGAVSVVVGDATLGQSVADALRRLGIAAHVAGERRLSQSEPAAFLRCLLGYLASRSLEDAGRLLRQPAFEAWLRRYESLERIGEDPSATYDRVARSCFAREAPASGATLLVAVDAAAEALLAEPKAIAEQEALLAQPGTSWASVAGSSSVAVGARLRAFHDWMAVVGRCLERAFQAAAEERSGLGEELRAALEAFGALLGEAAAATRAPRSVTAPEAARLDLAGAVGVLLHVLGSAEEAPREGSLASLEVIGWLEVAHDDAPWLVVLGLNEGSVPESVGGEPLLGERVRRILGLVDDRRRHARDAFLLEAALHARSKVVLVAGRVGGSGEPLLPSRLLLQRAAGELAPAVLDLYREPEGSGQVAWPLATWPHLSREAAPRLGIPPPEPLAQEITELPVTAFGRYLRCPYRFYLRQGLGLETYGDAPRELDPGEFGSLAHDALKGFARGPHATSQDPAQIEATLRAELRRLAAERYGSAPLATVRVQLALLERRFAPFARWQARQSTEGWRMVPEGIECSLTALLEVDGRPFRVLGRIDRIDVHPELGVRLIDYKTGERPVSPDALHRKGARRSPGRAAPGKQWVDLQLPLYDYLLRASPELPPGVRSALPAGVELGLYCLSKKLSAPPYLPAPWGRDDLDEALEVARDVVRAVRAQRFWPPGEPPAYEDGLHRLAGDVWGARSRLQLAEPEEAP